MLTLGISAYYHDSAAALVQDGRPVAAAQEERFSRNKHDAGFPHGALRACLARVGAELRDVDRVVFYEKPLVKFERLLETWLAVAPRGFGAFATALPQWLGGKLFLRSRLLAELAEHGSLAPERLTFASHHHSHAASAFYPCPFDEAVVLTVDGVGEWETTTQGIGRGGHLELHRSLHFPHSLGLLYSAFTVACGFRVNSGEYKLMGLAPYGRPVHADRIRDHLIDVRADGSFQLDVSCFGWCTGRSMTSEGFHRLFGAPHPPDTPPTQHQMDLAASIQTVLEDVLGRMVRHAVAESGIRRLCLAGGVALNCVANGRLLRDGIVDELWVQPAAGDAGGALGAALVGAMALGDARSTDSMGGSALGPSWSDDAIASTLRSLGARLSTPQDLDAAVVEVLQGGKVVGWFQGAVEFGPRALGNRSILADPRDSGMKDRVNSQVKRREAFRPFAPSVLASSARDWFDLDADSPFMTLTAPVSQPEALPAVTHVDGSARIQTVHPERHPRFHRLLERWGAATGCAVLLNTSFNVRGEPIVCSPADAWHCFRTSGLDALAIGRNLLLRDDQDREQLAEARDFPLD